MTLRLKSSNVIKPSYKLIRIQTYPIGVDVLKLLLELFFRVNRVSKCFKNFLERPPVNYVGAHCVEGVFEGLEH
jgi:hypothetical protein